jgi:hypothetical protein
MNEEQQRQLRQRLSHLWGIARYRIDVYWDGDVRISVDNDHPSDEQMLVFKDDVRKTFQKHAREMS